MSYELTVVRLLAASPEEVWDAYTDPEQMKAWFTILDDPMIVEIEGEVRVGGELRVRWGFSPDQLFWENQTFSVLDRPGRIVSRSTGGDPSGGSLTTDVEITFAEKGGKTLMTVNQSGFPDEATRDFFATTAWIGFFDRIEAYLTRRVEDLTYRAAGPGDIRPGRRSGQALPRRDRSGEPILLRRQRT